MLFDSYIFGEKVSVGVNWILLMRQLDPRRFHKIQLETVATSIVVYLSNNLSIHE